MLLAMSTLIASFGVTILFGAPYVGTNKRDARNMLEFARIKRGESVLDIGSGLGTIPIVAGCEFGAAKVHGIEMNPFLVVLSRIRAKRAGVEVDISRKNAYTAQIPRADVIALYLLPRMMDRLKPQLASKLDPGARIVSRGFQFSHISPREVKTIGNQHFYLYHAGDLM